MRRFLDCLANSGLPCTVDSSADRPAFEMRAADLDRFFEEFVTGLEPEPGPDDRRDDER